MSKLIWEKKRAAFHGRSKMIWRDTGECNVCDGDARSCLGFDTSEEEYGAFWICEDCAAQAFADDIGHLVPRGTPSGGTGDGT